MPGLPPERFNLYKGAPRARSDVDLGRDDRTAESAGSASVGRSGGMRIIAPAFPATVAMANRRAVLSLSFRLLSRVHLPKNKKASPLGC
jgi:hypothetical protein